METGAIVAVTLHGADVGDTATIPETEAEVKQVSTDGPREVVTDKGYHSRALVSEPTERGLRTYCSAPPRAATVARATAGTASWVCQSATHSRRATQPAVQQRGEKLERWNQLTGVGHVASICDAGETFSSG
jgi:hypothetical protein